MLNLKNIIKNNGDILPADVTKFISLRKMDTVSFVDSNFKNRKFQFYPYRLIDKFSSFSYYFKINGHELLLTLIYSIHLSNIYLIINNKGAMMSKIDKYPPDVSLALNTWIKLARSFASFDKKTTENIRTYNLTVTQFGVIDVLAHLGPMTIGKLCEKMLLTGGNMTLVLDNMEKNNLVKRSSDPNDRRAIKIHLTAKGNKLFSKIFSSHAEYIKKLMSVLSNDEQNTLGQLLKKLGTGVAAIN